MVQEGFNFSTPDWDVVGLTYVTVAAREKDKNKQSHVGHTLATRRSVMSLHCENDFIMSYLSEFSAFLKAFPSFFQYRMR